ncbi:zinc finger protein 658B [Austrofundulus limnaeus]|uniref:Zinc finger protein 658B n=1 Tax=Austrofundulus limnaeus TaxID=52670 RepID=A0A2I4D3N1_AUSLI|nr:PREDICTED: zinc finger protein 658B-like [Austrofundulus limnaeus]
MCSVYGCYSGLLNAERFKLPEDPEERLEWVMFLAKTNKQRFKESSWTDIAVCSDHFTGDCFVDEAHPVQLKPGSVPSVCLKSGPDEPVRSSGCEELEDNSQCADLQDPLNTSPDPTPYSKGSSLKPLGSSTDPFATGPSRSPGSSECGQARAEQVNADLVKEKMVLLQKKGKLPVNESHLRQLFGSDCPSCGGKLKVHKVICGVVVSFNQLCLQCDYTYEWKSQVDGSVPAAEDGHVKAGLEVATGDEAPSSILEVPEIVAVAHEGSGSGAEWEQSSDPGEVDSDEEWKSAPHVFPIKLYPANPTEESGKHVEYRDYLSLTPVHSQLCADCGRFVDGRKPHVCEHKARPYSCYICGKRCVSEAALSSHGRVHNESHEFRCKFCHATFKLKADKVTHEQTHGPEGRPYKCPDCSKTFATNKERRVHLEDHRGAVDLKCRFCGVEFDRPLSIQRHLLVHTGVKPYKCLVCQRSFNQASHLKSHMRLHTGERPYKCQLCDKSFNHNVSLKSHVQRHHPSCSTPEQTKGTKSKKKSGGAQNNRLEEDADVNLDSEEKEQDTDDEMEARPQTKRNIGRPKGRPKGFGSGMKTQAEGSHTGARKSQVRRRKRQKITDEDRLSDGNTSFDSEDEG